jgi:hypothetical protein
LKSKELADIEKAPAFWIVRKSLRRFLKNRGVKGYK